MTSLKEGDVLFIDEIHRLQRSVEEVLYPAMEDFVLDIIIGKGPSAKSIRLDLPKFTLVGATTRAGLLTAPLRDRFGVVQRLELYNQVAVSYTHLSGVSMDALRKLKSTVSGRWKAPMRRLMRLSGGRNV